MRRSGPRLEESDFLVRMQAAARSVALDPATWSEGLREDVHRVFDNWAGTWGTNVSQGYLAPLGEALESLDVRGRTCLDVGSGTALQEVNFGSRFERVILLDFSHTMLRRADRQRGAPLQADASALPIGTGLVDVVVCVNMFLFAGEYARVLAEGGCIVIVSTRGSQTPIYVDSSVVESALDRHAGASFEVTTGRAGHGAWTIARRAAKEMR